jgi:hypothetical protein
VGVKIKGSITKLFSYKLDLYFTFSKFTDEFKDKQLPFTYLSQWCRDRLLLRVELVFKDDLVHHGAGTLWQYSIKLGASIFEIKTRFKTKNAAKEYCALYVLYRLKYFDRKLTKL